MKSSGSKMIIGAAAVGVMVGAAVMANRMREDNRSQFEKFLDQMSEYLHL